MDAIKWNKLRTKYFKECVWHDSMDGNKIRIDYAPHDLFEWFKREITTSEGNTIEQSTEQQCNIADVSVSCEHPFNAIAIRKSDNVKVCTKCGKEESHER